MARKGMKTNPHVIYSGRDGRRKGGGRIKFPGDVSEGCVSKYGNGSERRNKKKEKQRCFGGRGFSKVINRATPQKISGERTRRRWRGLNREKPERC